MKSNFLFYGLLTFCVFGATVTQPQPVSTNESERLLTACSTLSVTPADTTALQVLLDYSRSTSSIPQLKSRAMAAFTLAALVQGDTNLFVRAQNSHASNFPNDRDLVSIRLESCFVPCKTCRGYGRVDQTCMACTGTRKCSICGGDGRVLDKNMQGHRDNSMACTQCRGTGICPVCAAIPFCTACGGDGRLLDKKLHGGPDNSIPCKQCGGTGVNPAARKGTDRFQKLCPACKGQRYFCTPPVTVLNDYRTILSEIRQILQDEAAIAMQIRQAKSEPVLEVRIRLLSQLLEKLHKRPEAGDLERLLLRDQQALDELKREQTAKTSQREQLLTTLRGLKTSDNPKAAVITLRDYLAVNQDSPDRIEVQAILNECLGKLEKQRKREKQLCWFGGILIVLFGLSCVHINYFKYTLLPSYTSAAKRTRTPNAEPLTDPLTLTTQESKARAQTNTPRPPSVDAGGDSR